jgi:hypothetical protein
MFVDKVLRLFASGPAAAAGVFVETRPQASYNKPVK